MKRTTVRLLFALLLAFLMLGFSACDDLPDGVGDGIPDGSQTDDGTPDGGAGDDTASDDETDDGKSEGETDDGGEDTHTHVFDRRVVTPQTMKSEASCESAAVFYYSCACGAKGDASFASGAPAHTFTVKKQTAAYKKSDASCSAPASYYFSCACGAKGTAIFTVGEKVPHSHKAVETVSATCKTKGYTLYRCACGDSYRGDPTPVSYDHKFEWGIGTQDGYTFGCYVCQSCGLYAAAYGNTNGTWYKETDSKYYVTGNLLDNTDYEIVVYGKGPMLAPIEGSDPMWSGYLLSAKRIVVAEGITSVFEGAFYLEDGGPAVEYDIAESVKVLEYRALGLPTSSLTLRAVEEIYYLPKTTSQNSPIFLPKTLKYIYSSFPNRCAYYYEGTEEELYANVKTRIIYRDPVSIQSQLSNNAGWYSFCVEADYAGDPNVIWIDP